MKEGWEILSLADVCEFQRGLTYSKGDEAEFSGNVVLRANNVDLLTNQLNLSELKYISDQIQIPSSKVLRPGSLLICTASGSKSHLGKVAFVDKDYGYAFGGFMGQITPLPSLLPRFLFHALTSEAYKKFISALSDGANINNLKFDDLARFQIPVPPLPEQQRIVALLDEAFAGLATTKANAERNLRNARAVFESHLESVFSQRGEEWTDSTIGAENRFIDYRGKTPTKTATGIPLITAKNIKMGFLQEEPKEFIAEGDYASWMTRGIPEKGDVLFTTEAPLANVAQLGTDEKVAFAQRVIIMQPDKTRIDSCFLKYLLLSKPVQDRIRLHGTGATVQGIKASLLRLIKISFPQSIEQQESVARRLDALTEETQLLNNLYERKLAALEELKQSLLQQAFNGEL